MSDLPLVSVVIATRNRPEMLREALAAVAAQTYAGPMECIVVFDQTEPDLTLATDDHHRGVRVITNNRTPGLAGARNTGILAATGEYVAFCDDDDAWVPAKTERQLAGIGDALTSVAGIVIHYGSHETTRVPDPATFTLANVVRNRLMEGHPSTVIMRRQAILDKIGLVDEVLPGSYGEDFDYMIRALKAGRVAVVAEPLCIVHWGSSMFSRDWGTIVAAIDYLIAKHPEFRADPKALAQLSARRGFANAALGRTKEALADEWRTFKLSPTEKRIYVTLLVCTRLVSAPKVLDIAHKRGRGV